MKHFYIVILILVFFIQFLFVNPIGNFALNDDWVHADSVLHLINTGNLRIMPFAGATFHAQILYGAVWTKLFGFSFSILRISTLFLMLSTILVYFILLKKILKNENLAFIGTIVLWFNPIIYNLSFTFMTDIPALFLMILAMLLYYLGFQKNEKELIDLKTKQKTVLYFFLGSFVCIIGAYTRQTNILLLVASGIAVLLRKKLNIKEILISFGVPILFGGALYIWFSLSGILPQTTDSHIVQGFGRWFGHLKWWLWYIPIYIGLFMLPITYSIAWKEIKNYLEAKNLFVKKHKNNLKQNTTNNFFWIAPVLFIGFAILIRQVFHLQLPYVLNMIHLFGLGPMGGVMEGKLIPLWGPKIWGLITIASAGSAGICLNLILKKNQKSKSLLFIYIFGGLYTLTLLMFESFDRYIIFLIPIITILLFSRIKKISFTPFFLITILFVIYSITQTQYYIEWNRERWNIANSAVKMYELSPNQIDAGYEWNGWNTYWKNASLGLEPQQEPKTLPWWIRGLFFNNTREYIISWSPVDGYSVIKSSYLKEKNPNNQIFLLSNEKNNIEVTTN